MDGTGDVRMKIRAFMKFWDSGEPFYVHIRPEDCVVPPGIKGCLQFGANMPVPITDMRTSPLGVRATLRFGGTYFEVLLPWPAIYAIVDEKRSGWFWEADAPSQALAEIRRSQFRVIPGGKASPSGSSSPSPTTGGGSTAA
jgi:hypothetical protein